MEFTLIRTSVEAVFAESSENLSDVVGVLVDVFGVDEDVVEIDDDADVKEIVEDVVHEPLKRSRSIGETKGHYKPFEGAVAGAESSLPFVAFRDSD